MSEKQCVCGHELESRGYQVLELHGESLLKDYMDVELWVCPRCGRIAFFMREKDRKDRYRAECGGRTDEELSALTCEQCGMTYAECQKCGMLGCANCYKAFKAPLDALLQRIHGNTQHAGRIPGSVRSGVSIRMNIDRLRQRLQKAIAEEEYEQAARLRDSIRALTAQLAENEKQTDIKVAPPKRIVAEDAEGGEFDD